MHPPFNQHCRPLTNKWSVEAQRVHGIERDWARTQQHPADMGEQFLKYVQGFDCLFTMVGFNCLGDMNYVHRLMAPHMIEWKKATRFEWRDVHKRALDRKAHLPIKSFKLPDLAKYYGLEYDAHDALADAYMTREIDERLSTIKIRDTVQYREEMSGVDKRAKYTATTHLQIGGDGSVFIFDHATKNPEAMKCIIEELWDVFVEGR